MQLPPVNLQTGAPVSRATSPVASAATTQQAQTNIISDQAEVSLMASQAPVTDEIPQQPSAAPSLPTPTPPPPPETPGLLTTSTGALLMTAQSPAEKMAEARVGRLEARQALSPFHFDPIFATIDQQAAADTQTLARLGFPHDQELVTAHRERETMYQTLKGLPDGAVADQQTAAANPKDRSSFFVDLLKCRIHELEANGQVSEADLKAGKALVSSMENSHAQILAHQEMSPSGVGFGLTSTPEESEKALKTQFSALPTSSQEMFGKVAGLPEHQALQPNVRNFAYLCSYTANARRDQLDAKLMQPPPELARADFLRPVQTHSALEGIPITHAHRQLAAARVDELLKEQPGRADLTAYQAHLSEYAQLDALSKTALPLLK